MLRPGTLSLTLLLSLLTAIGPLSVDMYLAALPDIGRLLGAPPEQVQLTLSFYLVGFALGQVFYGPLSDRHGRRPVLLAAIGVYMVASVACALAPSIELLIAARFCQALGGAGTMVLARAVVRDLYEGAQVGRELSRMASIMALAPIIAPLLGGTLQTFFGWRSNFVALVMFGMITFSMVWFLFPETLRQRSPEPVSLMSTLRSYRMFATHRSFIAHLGLSTCSFIGLYMWIFSAAFVLQDVYGLSALAFGVMFALGSVGYMCGTAAAARFVMRWGVNRTIGFGCAAMAAGGLLMVLVVLAGFKAAPLLVLSMSLYLGGMGMVLPQAQAGALLPFANRAGAASSLLGLVQQTAAAVLGATIGHTLGQTSWPLAVCVATAGCLALLVWATTRRIRAAALPVLVQRRPNRRSISQLSRPPPRPASAGPAPPAAAAVHPLRRLRAGPGRREARGRRCGGQPRKLGDRRRPGAPAS